MSLFSQVITGMQFLDTIMDKNKEDTGNVYGESAAQTRSRIDFSQFKRDSMKPADATEVKANQAISYEELNRIWDTILPNAYAELVKRVEQPAFSSRKDI